MEKTQSPGGKLLMETAGAVILYYVLFVLGPALQEPTSELRCRLSELRERGRELRDELRVARFRVEIDQLERMRVDDA